MNNLYDQHHLLLSPQSQRCARCGQPRDDETGWKASCHVLEKGYRQEMGLLRRYIEEKLHLRLSYCRVINASRRDNILWVKYRYASIEYERAVELPSDVELIGFDWNF